ncbi:MAG: alpha-glucan family phosphorylase [Candidatus Sumerlaeia bacterium]|nr:alpha-glucan family phosphorylase [Candidatus Sumerlaeia bacterium]
MVRVLPNFPPELAGLEDLAYNLWWAWNPTARFLFRRIHEPTWHLCEGNPVRFINAVHQNDLNNAAKDPDICALYDTVMAQFNEYMSGRKSWYKRQNSPRKGELIAYFSAEYGLHESLPIYSGGLGVLAGDHLKSASDIGLPFIAVGMLYREGYFIQDIDPEGHQRAIYRRLDWNTLPVRPAVNEKGEEVTVTVNLAGRDLHARVWKVQVGRVSLFLLDTDIASNSDTDRRLTSRLYGGDHETRIQQEVLLGVGGIKALRLLGYEPTVFHMNEGHSVFLGLERLREYIHDHGLAFREALEVVRGTSLFTTHTPVPAGNDAFSIQLMEKYFRQYWESIGISRAKFLSLGLDTMPDGSQLFSLTVLALNLSSMANGVSELHGHVSRAMWQHVWPDLPADEIPIRHVTNGIHTRTWLSLDMERLFDKYFELDWRERIEDPAVWSKVDSIPDDELWAVIGKLRFDMIDFIHRRLTKQHIRFGDSPEQIQEWAGIFDKDALTIGFARRFATYKRATLLFRDKERLSRILNNPERPVQIVFAGKAHPADQPGQALIREIQKASKDEAFRGRVLFLENYDINVGRRLVSGVDVWLNNPRRPYEASGTSGMKVPINGGINCSILDGWWVEAYRQNPESGWALGGDIEYEDPNLQDAADAESIYSVLESQIVPLYYDRDERGLPVRWLRRVRESMKTVGPQFSTSRMVENYAEMFYFAGSSRYTLLTANRFERACRNAEWRDRVRGAWPSIRIHSHVEPHDGDGITVRVREKIEIVADVELGAIDPDDVSVQIYVAPLYQSCTGRNFRGGTIPMHPDGRSESGAHRYRGSLLEGDSGKYGFTVRVVPKHPDLVHPNEMGLMAWAQPNR